MAAKTLSEIINDLVRLRETANSIVEIIDHLGKMRERQVNEIARIDTALKALGVQDESGYAEWSTKDPTAPHRAPGDRMPRPVEPAPPPFNEPPKLWSTRELREHELAEQRPAEAAEPPPPEPPKEQAAPREPRMIELFREEAIEVLRQKGRPMTGTEMADALLSDRRHLPSWATATKNPTKLVGSYLALSRPPFINIPRRGYWLADEPVPEEEDTGPAFDEEIERLAEAAQETDIEDERLEPRATHIGERQ